MPRPGGSSTGTKKSKKGRAAADTNKALAEANARMQAQLADLQAQLAMTRAQATAPAPPAAVSTEIIPRPAGEHGRDWNLYTKLSEYGITRSEYKHMLAKVRDNATIARVNRSDVYRNQDPIKLAQIFAAMRKSFPVLKRFRSDWATAEMLKQALKNWRSKARLQEANGMAQETPIEPVSSREVSPEI